MKRYLIFCAAALLAGAAALAQNPPSTAALIAERQEIEEKYKALAATVEALQASNAALQKKLAELAAEVQALREGAGRPPANMATQEDLQKLAKSIVELDQTRAADNKLVVEKIQELAKLIAKAPAPANPAPRPAPTPSEKGYEHVVAAGDTLSKIIKDFREAGIKVTQKQVEDANPEVNWNRLQIGQKIWIPAPPK